MSLIGEVFIAKPRSSELPVVGGNGVEQFSPDGRGASRHENDGIPQAQIADVATVVEARLANRPGLASGRLWWQTAYYEIGATGVPTVQSALKGSAQIVSSKRVVVSPECST